MKTDRQTSAPVASLDVRDGLRLDENDDSLEDAQYQLWRLSGLNESAELGRVESTEHLTQVDQQDAFKQHVQAPVCVRYLLTLCQSARQINKN